MLCSMEEFSENVVCDVMLVMWLCLVRVFVFVVFVIV